MVWPKTSKKTKEDDSLAMKLTARSLLGLALIICLAGSALADEPTEDAGYSCSLLERETLTNNWFGLGDELNSRGIAVGLSATQIYQQNVHGGLSTHRRSGRHSGSYNLELEFDLETIFNLTGGSISVEAEGSWSEGIDGPAVGSLFGVNDDAGGYRAMDVTQLYYEQSLLEGTLKIRVGKLNLTGGFECRGCPVAFDGNSFANDETTQFLNGAFVNNPTIPFPEEGLGLVVYFQPSDCCYISAGLADAQADARESGFATTFNGDHYFFYILEAGLAPQIPSARGNLQGTYRIGLWYDPQPKDRLDGNGSESDDVGFYLSLDQTIWRENNIEDDNQGLGVFARYGLADDKINEVQYFWSAGCQYQGLLPSRDDDVLGFAVAQGRLSGDASPTASCETAFELYYNAQITPWLSISPSIQYIAKPGGDNATRDATVLAVRMQMSF